MAIHVIPLGSIKANGYPITIDINASILWLVACESEQANLFFFLIIIFLIEAIFGLGEKVKKSFCAPGQRSVFLYTQLL
jgi:hypothetical protein